MMSDVICDVIGTTRLHETWRDYHEMWLLLLYMVTISTKMMSYVICDIIGATRPHYIDLPPTLQTATFTWASTMQPTVWLEPPSHKGFKYFQLHPPFKIITTWINDYTEIFHK